jgi:DNA-binding NtrC family response regulator
VKLWLLAVVRNTLASSCDHRLVMPHVGGLRLIEWVRGKWPQLPVILITGYPSAHAGDMILEGRAAQIMTKPINLDERLETVKRILKAKGST